MPMTTTDDPDEPHFALGERTDLTHSSQYISSAFDALAVSRWRPGAETGADRYLPLIGADDVRPILPGIDLWDCWPLEHRNGLTVGAGVHEWWFFLSSPQFDDPNLRHAEARIRLIARVAGAWVDHGPVFADGFTPGDREWAGSAVRDDDGAGVTLYFTAAGRRGDAPSFEQRLFAARGRVNDATIGDWEAPVEIVTSDATRYVHVVQTEGETGTIKAFRDPAYFCDPADGREYILFVGSAGWDDHAFNGVVGCAQRIGGNWVLADPIVDAVGVNNELERPHMRVADGRYYLFFSTQRHTFAGPDVAGPNGLYAMVADRMAGPWRAVNGSGLVAANPLTEPKQAYSWWVTGEHRVVSFIDYWGMAGRDTATDPALLRQQFGGTPAPEFGLRMDGDRIDITN